MVWRGIEAPPELEGVRVKSIDGGPKFIDIKQGGQERGGEQGRRFLRSKVEAGGTREGVKERDSHGPRIPLSIYKQNPV